MGRGLTHSEEEGMRWRGEMNAYLATASLMLIAKLRGGETAAKMLDQSAKMNIEELGPQCIRVPTANLGVLTINIRMSISRPLSRRPSLACCSVVDGATCTGSPGLHTMHSASLS